MIAKSVIAKVENQMASSISEIILLEIVQQYIPNYKL